MANVNFHGYTSGGSGGAVDSVNGKTGAVVLYGTDIALSSSVSETITSEIGDINTTLSGLATVATTGDYDDLIDRPSLATVATTGNYADLIDKPSLATVAITGDYDDLIDKPSLAAVATTGDYDDLIDKPSLATVATTGDYDDLIDKPSLATVATSGSYADLTNKPTIPDDLNDLDDVVLTSPQNAQVLKYDSATSKWVNANESGGGGGATIDDSTISTLSCWSSSKTNTEITNRHKVTNVAVDLTGWTQDTTSQSGTTLYKKQVALTHIYTTPEVEIGAGTGYVLPTTSEQESYDLIQYTTYDDTIPCLYLYASDIPQTAFYINVGGVD